MHNTNSLRGGSVVLLLRRLFVCSETAKWLYLHGSLRLFWGLRGLYSGSGVNDVEFSRSEDAG